MLILYEVANATFDVEPYAAAIAVRLAWRWKAPDFLSPACCSGFCVWLFAGPGGKFIASELLRSGDSDVRPPDGYSFWCLCFQFDLQRCSGKFSCPAVLAAIAVVLQHLRELILSFWICGWVYLLILDWHGVGVSLSWYWLYAALGDVAVGSIWFSACCRIGYQWRCRWVPAMSDGDPVSWASSSGAVLDDSKWHLAMLMFLLVAAWIIISVGANLKNDAPLQWLIAVLMRWCS
ncbi:hypothetical protein Nepgr_023012 [Nepenthes gracilis]|uniref:Uncharacterized protein n=1 Tax=Nepenthes gracilis TaxID=150966 RepID=A0AAD3T0I0_NEPGR|nr:hypothetical protein Nepgr_023012 [Nepenthes gracilis]